MLQHAFYSFHWTTDSLLSTVSLSTQQSGIYLMFSIVVAVCVKEHPQASVEVSAAKHRSNLTLLLGVPESESIAKEVFPLTVDFKVDHHLPVVHGHRLWGQAVCQVHVHVHVTDLFSLMHYTLNTLGINAGALWRRLNYRECAHAYDNSDITCTCMLPEYLHVYMYMYQ